MTNPQSNAAKIVSSRWMPTLLALTLSLATVGCNSSPADTRAADEAAVRKADADWVAAAQTKSADAWVAFYADDAVALPPNDQTLTSKDAMRKSIADMLALPGFSIHWTPTKVEVARSGDLAYLYGTYELGFKDAAGKPMPDHGKMTEIWRKQPDGNWKCIVDMWSSDIPLPAAK